MFSTGRLKTLGTISIKLLGSLEKLREAAALIKETDADIGKAWKKK